MFSWPDAVYTGNFFENKITGKGVLKWSDGRVYDGYWKDGKMNGDGGTMTWPDGKVKKGTWEDGHLVKEKRN